MKFIELTVGLDHGTPRARTLSMTFNLDHIISVAPSKHSEHRCWMKLTDETFIDVLRPYKELLFALRAEMMVA